MSMSLMKWRGNDSFFPTKEFLSAKNASRSRSRSTAMSMTATIRLASSCFAKWKTNCRGGTGWARGRGRERRIKKNGGDGLRYGSAMFETMHPIESVPQHEHTADPYHCYLSHRNLFWRLLHRSATSSTRGTFLQSRSHARKPRYGLSDVNPHRGTDCTLPLWQRLGIPDDNRARQP